MWDCSVFTQYSYYRYFFCLGPSLRLCNRHRHGWARYIDTKNITVWCMSSLLLSIDLRWFCYFIMFDLKLTNGEMVKRRMVKWCNGKIKISVDRFFSHKYQICSFFIFKHNIFASDKAIHNFQSLITNNKYSNQVYLIILKIRNKQTLIWYCNI